MLEESEDVLEELRLGGRVLDDLVLLRSRGDELLEVPQADRLRHQNENLATAQDNVHTRSSVSIAGEPGTYLLREIGVEALRLVVVEAEAHAVVRVEENEVLDAFEELKADINPWGRSVYYWYHCCGHL